MANNNQNNAANMPLTFRLAVVLVLVYGAAWLYDDVVDNGRVTDPTKGAQEAVKAAVTAANARVWK